MHDIKYIRDNFDNFKKKYQTGIIQQKLMIYLI